MLRDLVFSFDCADGQDETIYMHTKQLLVAMLGLHVAELFSKYVDACEGKFYIKTGHAEECWHELCETAKWPDPNK
jgi:hypothetical protein